MSYELTTEQVDKLCETLGLDKDVHKTQRIVIDIDCNRQVHVYTMALASGNQLTNLFMAVDNIVPSNSAEIKGA